MRFTPKTNPGPDAILLPGEHAGAMTKGTGWLGLLLSTGLVAAVGVLAGWLQPLGPITAAEAIAWLAGGAATGLIAGLLARSRWMLWLAPVGFIVAFEIARSGAGLVTTGPLRLGSAFGPLAYLLGRLAAWGLATVSLLAGVGWGSRGEHARHRPVGPLIATGLTVVLAVALLLPATSPPLRDAEGRPNDGAVSELVRVELGGHEQWIQVRGASPNLPVLLYLSGGPGQSDLPYSRVLFAPLTDDFLVVGWDQRGTGKSYPALDAETLTLDQAVADTVELAGLLAERYGQQKIYLLGESWGSLLGVLAVQQAPEMFHAYLGSGQMVDVRASDEAIYRDLIVQAMSQGDGELVARLISMGPPPYRGGTLDYATIFSLYPLIQSSYTPPLAYRQRGDAARLGPWGVLGQEYAWLEKINVLRGLLDMNSVMYPQLQALDLRRSARTLEVPVYLLVGEHELAARSDLAREWFDLLDAPDKGWYQLPDSGHSVAFEQADELHRILLNDVQGAR